MYRPNFPSIEKIFDRSSIEEGKILIESLKVTSTFDNLTETQMNLLLSIIKVLTLFFEYLLIKYLCKNIPSNEPKL